MPLEFPCPACKQLVRTPEAAAGKKGRCPQCGAIVQIPGPPAASASGAWKGAPPMPPPPSGARFRGGEGGPASQTPAPGLTPLGPPISGGGLTPLPSDALPASSPWPAADPLAGLAPLAGDLLAELPPAGNLPPAPKSRWPAAFDAPQRSSGPAAPRSAIDDRFRRGLQWERCPSMDAFWDTILQVVSAPQDAFASMRRFGGIGNPLGFVIVSYVTAQVLMLLEFFLLQGGAILLAKTGTLNLGPHFLNLPWSSFFLAWSVIALIQITGAVLSACVGALVTAVFFHVVLLALGGARGGFEATYRVVAFGTGSAYMLLPIPIVGPICALVMQPLVLIYGLMHAHETSGWKAIVAVLAPGTLAVCCLGLVLVTVLPSTLVISAGP